MLRASRGRGIVLAHSDDEVVDASLYTKLFTGHRVREYRVYIVNGQAVDIIEKRRRGRAWCREHGVDRDSEYTNLIRSFHNGWVFARNTIEATPTEQETICLAAESAANAISLGYGCVDMIVDRYASTGDLRLISVVETNTSPGIDRNATTTRKLAEGIANTIGAL
jgi:glutathione synthase/RimK-type ligase-like ATP-grasp enzyme